MEWLNYHHLLYFWAAAKEGGIARGAARLRRSQPTVSAQIHELESAFGTKLFTRSGKRVVLTENGQRAYRYADEIFSLGQELREVLRGRPSGRPLRLVVGIVESLPKFVALRLLEPALHPGEPMKLVCREDTPDRLLAALVMHEVDVVLSDAPAGRHLGTTTYDHLLGQCGATFFGARRHASLRRGFPRSLGGAPMLLPAVGSPLRTSLDGWFEKLGIHPVVYGEFDDNALIKIFGQAGAGVFAVPTIIEKHVLRTFGVAVIGRTRAVRERFYAISAERKLKHPAVMKISEAARHAFGRVGL